MNPTISTGVWGWRRPPMTPQPHLQVDLSSELTLSISIKTYKQTNKPSIPLVRSGKVGLAQWFVRGLVKTTWICMGRFAGRRLTSRHLNLGNYASCCMKSLERDKYKSFETTNGVLYNVTLEGWIAEWVMFLMSNGSKKGDTWVKILEA